MVFAETEGVLLLAALAQRFRFELAPGQRVAAQPRVTLAPRGGVTVYPRAVAPAAPAHAHATR